MGCSLPGSSVHGVFQARILEWIAVPSSRRSSQSGDGNCIFCVSCIGRQVLYQWHHLRSPPTFTTPAKYVQLLTLGSCDCDLIWKKGLCRYKKVDSQDKIILDSGQAWNQMTNILIEDRREDANTKGKSQVKMDAETGVMSQGMPRVASCHQKLKEGHGRIS